MGVGDHDRPLLTRDGLDCDLAVAAGACAAAAEDEHAGVARVVECAQHAPVAERCPGQFAFALTGPDPGREAEPVLVERLHDCAGRPGGREGLEQVAEGVLHALVGVEDDSAGGVVDEPDRERYLELAAAGLRELPAAQAGADEVQLGLAHRALQAKQQPVVEVAWVVEAVFVEDQRARRARRSRAAGASRRSSSRAG